MGFFDVVGKKSHIGFGGGLIGGGTYSPTTSWAEANIYHQPYETYAPQIQFAPQTSYAYQGATTIISSPGAESKKEQRLDLVSKPAQKGAWDIPTSISQAPSAEGAVQGTNMMHIAIIAVVGAAAIMFLKKKK